MSRVPPVAEIIEKLKGSDADGVTRARLLERFSATHAHSCLRDLQLATLACLRKDG